MLSARIQSENGGYNWQQPTARLSLSIGVMVAPLTRKSGKRIRRQRALRAAALPEIDPLFERINLRADQVVIFHSAVAHPGNVIHRKNLFGFVQPHTPLDQL